MPPPTVAGIERLLGAGDVLAVPVHLAERGPARLGAGADVVKRLRIDPDSVLRDPEVKGSPGDIIEVPVTREGVKTLVLLGVGDGSPAAMRKAGAALARKAKAVTSVATTATASADAEATRAFVEGFGLASYAFQMRSEPKPPTLERLGLVGDTSSLDAAAATVDAVWLARDLAQTPALEKTPEWMADRAVAVAAEAGLTATVWDEAGLRRDGFGGILAVGAGSTRPPRLVQMTYDGDGGDHIVLVGKGITFDTGGLSIKPLDNMKAMKTDMAGSAAVLATMSALRRLGARHKVTALLALAENMPSGSATRPGDVIRH